MKYFLLFSINLFFISFVNAVQQVSYENDVTAKKNLYISLPLNALNAVANSGCNFNGNIAIENLAINSTFSENTNIVSFGLTDQEIHPSITFANLPETTDQLNYLGLTEAGQLCIYYKEIPPDTLREETIKINSLAGNNIDTLLFKNPNGSINIGNAGGNLYFYTNQLLIKSPIDSVNQKIIFSKNVNTENINFKTLTTETLNITSPAVTIKANEGSFTSINTNGGITFGSLSNPIKDTTVTISKGTCLIKSLDKSEFLNVTASPMQTTENPSNNILILDATDKIVILPSSMTNGTITTISNCDNFIPKLITDTNTIQINIDNVEWGGESSVNKFLNINLQPTGSIDLSGKVVIFGTEISNKYLEKITIQATVAKRLHFNISAQEINIKKLTLNAPSSDNRFINTCSKNLYNAEDFPKGVFSYCIGEKVDPAYYRIYASNNKITEQKNRNKKNLQEIKTEDISTPKVFSYKKSYTEDICKKTKTQKQRIGFLNDQQELNFFDIIFDFYKAIEDKLDEEEQNEINMLKEIEKKIEKLKTNKKF